MRIVSLASGSGGNAYCIESEGRLLLIDCGLSYLQLKNRCTAAGLDVAKIEAVLFTHDHDDHMKGLDVFKKKHPSTDFFANLMTADAINADLKAGEADFVCFENGQTFTAGPFEIQPFAIPHDVPDPVGYLVRAEGLTYFHATDVGSPLDSVGIHLAEADVATLESNHDPVMLHQSNRRDSLKQRIRGPSGHLSNDQAADLVRRFASPKLTHLALAHLSGECNAPHLAENTMRRTLAEMKRTDISLKVLEQDCVVEIF